MCAVVWSAHASLNRVPGEALYNDHIKQDQKFHSSKTLEPNLSTSDHETHGWKQDDHD